MTTCSAIWVSTEAKSKAGCAGSKEMLERTHRLYRILPLTATWICRPSTLPSLCRKDGPSRNRANCTHCGDGCKEQKECAIHRAAHFGDMPISAQRSEHAQASVGNSPATLVRIDVSKPQVTNLRFRDDVPTHPAANAPTDSRTRLFDRTDQLAKFAQNHGRTMLIEIFGKIAPKNGGGRHVAFAGRA